MASNRNEQGQPKYTNRLIDSASPYLLQHAHNPVDWYPWGKAALTKARQEDKPILVSIGYSACHWCHVMEHESFEDEATAAIMNEHFVNIKVDREERPDIDSIYMTAVQAMTGRGGWPLNCFLLPDGTPFYGGTYYPPDEKAARYNMPSFKQVLLSLADAYKTRRSELLSAGRELLAHLQRLHSAPGQGTIDAATLDNAYMALAGSFDARHGGFGGAPKFPQPMTLEFLLRYHHRSGNADALRMLIFTLQKMATGGMYDQLGGGFHRYSVDDHWLVPHFEKMLYDNALLVRLYAETYQVSGDPFLRAIAEETLAYLTREMLHPAGGFYSTQDADSPFYPGGENEEGAFFVWTPEQVREALGADAELFGQMYGVTTRGNFEGRNILHVARPLGEIARVTGTPPERLAELVARGKQQLWQVREQRPKPARDDKVLTGWNAMLLRALVTAASAFENAAYLELARRNADFLLSTMRRSDGRLLRNWMDGTTPERVPAFLEDYALLIDGLLALYAADGNQRWLGESIALADAMLALFWDDAAGLFYDTGSDHDELVMRPRDTGDNAVPSGNSTAAEVLLRLAALTGNADYRTRAERVLAAMSELLARFPMGFGRMLCAADLALAAIKEVALVGDPAATDLQALRQVVLKPYRPHIVVAQTAPGDTAGPALTPLLAGRNLIDGKAAGYVCQQFTCQLPVTDPQALAAQL